ncbi:MAG: hypothetical protein U0893_25530 [Chloroflexota bacterium]
MPRTITAYAFDYHYGDGEVTVYALKQPDTVDGVRTVTVELLGDAQLGTYGQITYTVRMGDGVANIRDTDEDDSPCILVPSPPTVSPQSYQGFTLGDAIQLGHARVGA